MIDLQSSRDDSLPGSIAISGAWGYIGLKFVEAAKSLGIDRFVFDPGAMPDRLAGDTFERIVDEQKFYSLPCELFHLAVHPEHRGRAMSMLLERSESERLVVLNEKPMATPDNPDHCETIVKAVTDSRMIMMFDFPELFDPLTARIIELIRGFKSVRIDEIQLCRSKDREDRSNPRNRKRMVTIQYQESVHCLAFVLYLLAQLQGGLDPLFQGGVDIEGTSQPYDPPNPEAYAHRVDGKCDYVLRLGNCAVRGKTDFKLGAAWAKTRVIRGTGDGRPFTIEADYLEGEKCLSFNGRQQPWDPKSNSYEHVIRTLWRWQRLARRELLDGVYPNPAFARIAYQLSSVLWRSCHDKQALQLPSLSSLLSFDAGYRAAAKQLPRCAG